MEDKAAVQNRKRVKRHLEQKKESGFKRISCFISPEAYQRLQVMKQETEQATGELIEFLLMDTRASGDKNTIEDNVIDPPPSCPATIMDITPGSEPDQMGEDDIPVDHDIENPDDSNPADEPIMDTLPDQGEDLDFSGIDKENIPMMDRDRIIFQIHDLYPGRKFAQKRVDILNEAGILFNGREWVKKDFSDQLVRGRERMKARQNK